MAYRYLRQFRQRLCKGAQIVQIQIVPRIHAQPRLPRSAGGGLKLPQHSGFVLAAASMGPAFGVQLYAVCTQGFGRCHGAGIGIHKQTNAHAQSAAFGNQGAQHFALGGQVPAVVGGALLHAVGHKSGLVRAHRAHDVHQIVQGVAFDIEFALGP